jgi:uncharacterized membrane protein
MLSSPNSIKYSRVVLIIFYLFAGANHFINPQFYYPLIPVWIGHAEAVNTSSGIAEILLALLFAVKQYRKPAAIGIILLLLAFIPAHIYFIQKSGCISLSLCVPAWVAWIRLIVIHPLLILWAWSCRK